MYLLYIDMLYKFPFVEAQVLESLKMKVGELLSEFNLSDIFFAITNVGLDFFVRYTDLNSYLFVPRFVDQTIFMEHLNELVIEFEKQKQNEEKAGIEVEVNKIVESKGFTKLELAQRRLLKVMKDAKEVIEGRKRKFEGE